MEGPNSTVCFMFVSALLLGPLSMILARTGPKAAAAAFAMMAFAVSAFWISTAPFPVSLIAVLGIASGVDTIRKI